MNQLTLKTRELLKNKSGQTVMEWMILSIVIVVGIVMIGLAIQNGVVGVLPAPTFQVRARPSRKGKTPLRKGRGKASHHSWVNSQEWLDEAPPAAGGASGLEIELSRKGEFNLSPKLSHEEIDRLLAAQPEFSQYDEYWQWVEAQSIPQQVDRLLGWKPSGFQLRLACAALAGHKATTAERLLARERSLAATAKAVAAVLRSLDWDGGSVRMASRYLAKAPGMTPQVAKAATLLWLRGSLRSYNPRSSKNLGMPGVVKALRTAAPSITQEHMVKLLTTTKNESIRESMLSWAFRSKANLDLAWRLRRVVGFKSDKEPLWYGLRRADQVRLSRLSRAFFQALWAWGRDKQLDLLQITERADGAHHQVSYKWNWEATTQFHSTAWKRVVENRSTLQSVNLPAKLWPAVATNPFWLGRVRLLAPLMTQGCEGLSDWAQWQARQDDADGYLVVGPVTLGMVSDLGVWHQLSEMSADMYWADKYGARTYDLATVLHKLLPEIATAALPMSAFDSWGQLVEALDKLGLGPDAEETAYNKAKDELYAAAKEKGHLDEEAKAKQAQAEREEAAARERAKARNKALDRRAQKDREWAIAQYRSEYEKGRRLASLFRQVIQHLVHQAGDYFVHGRDGEIIHHLLKWVGYRRTRCALTSRTLTTQAWQADPRYLKYLESVVSKDEDIVHVETGFEGSIPAWMGQHGWKANQVWMISSSKPEWQIPLSSSFGGRSLRNIVLDDIEHSPQRLQKPRKWGELEYSPECGGFWARFYGIQDAWNPEPAAPPEEIIVPSGGGSSTNPEEVDVDDLKF